VVFVYKKLMQAPGDCEVAVYVFMSAAHRPNLTNKITSLFRY